MLAQADFAAGDQRYVLLMGGFWLWLLLGQYVAELFGRRVAAAHYLLFAALRWVRIMLHELSHAIVALVTGQDITRMHASHISGQVDFEGEPAYHGLVAAAPLLLWGAAAALTHYVMLAQPQPFWCGVGLSIAVPLLVMAGVPSWPDFRLMGLFTKFFTAYVVGSVALLGVLGAADTTVFVVQPGWGKAVYSAFDHIASLGGW